MAKRFIDTDLFDKEWFFALTPKMKCFVQFVRLKCDVAGVWSPNYTLASQYVGEHVCEADLLAIDNGEQFSKHPTGKIICVGFIEFQYGKLSEKCKPHQKVIAALEKHNLLDTLSGRVSHRVPERVSDTLEEKEEEEDKDFIVEQTQGAKDFQTFWTTYGKQEKLHECQHAWFTMSEKDRQEALRQVVAYAQLKPEVKFRAGPLKWLEGKCWQDNYIGQLNAQSLTPQGKKKVVL